MQSEQFHFSCEAYRAIYFEFPFHEASCHLRPEERGTETPLQNRNACFFCFEAHALFWGGQFFIACNPI
jgi:hypothetical protein